MSGPAIPERYRVPRLEGGRTDFARPAIAGGRETIIVDEWGPYDWKSPKLWPAGRSDASPLALRVLGPAGEWRVVGRDGIASLSRSSGRTGDTIVVTPAAGRDGDFSVELEYRGAATVSRFGEPAAAGVPVRFGWSRFVPEAVWHVTFAAIDSTAIVQPAGVPPAAAPTAAIDTSRLDLMWYRPPRPGIPQSRVLTEATARVRLAPGRYRLRTIADDAARVFVDGRVVLDDWTPGESRAKEVTVELGGEHTFRVEHLQLDGWYELRLDIEREAAE